MAAARTSQHYTPPGGEIPERRKGRAGDAQAIGPAEELERAPSHKTGDPSRKSDARKVPGVMDHLTYLEAARAGP